MKIRFLEKLIFIKKYKVNKILNMIVENDTIYISDNLGYLYAYNYIKTNTPGPKTIDHLVKFENTENKLIAVNQSNNLFYEKKMEKS